MPVTLDQILDSARDALPALHARRDVLALEAARAPAPPSFAAALRRDRVAVIAEVKRRSPSAGIIRADLDPGERARLYADHGAAAVSVLTDAPFFGGSMADLRAAAGVGVPILRKDFILDELQIVEARAAGAAAVLLIVRALSAPRLRALLAASAEHGLDALVEAHTGVELEQGLAAGARILGINSRDLDTFHIDAEGAWRLLARVPDDVIAVAESGMHDLEGVRRAADAGADAVLVGSALSASSSPAVLLQHMAGVPRRGR